MFERTAKTFYTHLVVWTSLRPGGYVVSWQRSLGAAERAKSRFAGDVRAKLIGVFPVAEHRTVLSD